MSLVTLCTATNPAAASPELSSATPANDTASEAETADFALQQTEVLELALADTASEASDPEIQSIPLLDSAIESQAEAIPTAGLLNVALLSAAESETGDRAAASPLEFAILLPDAASPDANTSAEVEATPASGELAEPDTVAQQPVTIPTFAASDECFADCNPSQRFDFRLPAQLSLSPVVPRVAQVPVPPSTPNAAPTMGTTPGTGSGTASDGQPTASPAADFDSPLPSTALTPPSLQLQGVYIYQGDESSARARITGVYPLTPRIQVGGSLDLTEGDVFSEGGDDGVNINELYVTLAPQDLPNLRFVLGQLDLTSYFDRNSFAKDAATQFFNPVFSTNPALAAAGIGSRQGALVNWTITDNLEARAVIFSSDRSISEFELNAFAGEVGLRLGNFIVRGTYVTSEDSGSGDGFQEIFNIDRGNGQFGASEGDRENAYGVNAEYFIPEIGVGIFGRYGYYENADIDEDGDAFNVGVNVYDLFLESDRLGVGYGQALSNDQLRRDNDDEIPDVLEVFYDFRLLPGVRVGVSYQSLNEFSESIAGFRVRGDFNLIPRRP